MLLSQLGLHGLVGISDWNLTSTSLSFNLSGTANSISSPTQAHNYLYIGQSGNNLWINTEVNNSAFVTSSNIDGEVIDNVGTNPLPSGNAIWLYNLTNFDFTDGGIVEASINITGGSFNPGAIDVNNVIVVWGFDEIPNFPDADYDLGTFVVPEPATYAIWMAVFAMAFVLRRKGR